MKLALLNKWHSKVWIFSLVSTLDRVGAIQTRHHLLRWGEGVHEEATCHFAEWWVLSEYNSFDHFPYSFGLLQFISLESDWSQNNKHSRNNFRRSWFYGFHRKIFQFSKCSCYVLLSHSFRIQIPQIETQAKKKLHCNFTVWYRITL